MTHDYKSLEQIMFHRVSGYRRFLRHYFADMRFAESKDKKCVTEDVA